MLIGNILTAVLAFVASIVFAGALLSAVLDRSDRLKTTPGHLPARPNATVPMQTWPSPNAVLSKWVQAVLAWEANVYKLHAGRWDLVPNVGCNMEPH